jgi:hypothetical protein
MIDAKSQRIFAGARLPFGMRLILGARFIPSGGQMSKASYQDRRRRCARFEKQSKKSNGAGNGSSCPISDFTPSASKILGVLSFLTIRRHAARPRHN